jgi:hypothetical protein
MSPTWFLFILEGGRRVSRVIAARSCSFLFSIRYQANICGDQYNTT